VGVDRRRDARLARLDVHDEAQQGPLVVALGEALALHQAQPLEFPVGQEEAVRRDEVDLAVRVAVAEEFLEEA